MTFHPAHRPARGAVALALVGLLSAACSLTGGPSADDSGGQVTGSADGSGNGAGGTVVLVTHESFVLPKKVIKAFEQESGYTLVVRASGDAGTLTNKLVLTQDNPTGDVAFGVDNTFASRALGAGVFAVADVTLPPGADAYALADGADRLFPVDDASVCVNIDKRWFASHQVPPPRTLDDLVNPTYRDLFVTPGATTSSPGMAFLLLTIAKYGDTWDAYWSGLMANGIRVTNGWSDAYYVDFTQGGGDGKRPIVVSYDTSPAFTVGDDGRSTTKALLDACFRQVEYAGVLAGADNPEGAQAFIEFLLGEQAQAALPESMYVFPVRDGVTLPESWARFAKQPSAPYTLDPADIAAQRDEWLTAWDEVVTR